MSACIVAWSLLFFYYVKILEILISIRASDTYNLTSYLGLITKYDIIPNNCTHQTFFTFIFVVGGGPYVI